MKTPDLQERQMFSIIPKDFNQKFYRYPDKVSYVYLPYFANARKSLSKILSLDKQKHIETSLKTRVRPTLINYPKIVGT